MFEVQSEQARTQMMRKNMKLDEIVKVTASIRHAEIIRPNKAVQFVLIELTAYSCGEEQAERRTETLHSHHVHNRQLDLDRWLCPCFTFQSLDGSNFLFRLKSRALPAWEITSVKNISEYSAVSSAN
nr:hypothetical protein CFP56_03930 [Quercus suber]